MKIYFDKDLEIWLTPGIAIINSSDYFGIIIVCLCFSLEFNFNKRK